MSAVKKQRGTRPIDKAMNSCEKHKAWCETYHECPRCLVDFWFRESAERDKKISILEAQLEAAQRATAEMRS